MASLCVLMPNAVVTSPAISLELTAWYISVVEVTNDVGLKVSK